MIDDCDVEFENIKFHRETFLQKDQEVEFTVMVTKATGRFEITEGLNAVVTGYVKAKTSELTNLYEHGCNQKCSILSSSDFYKELRVRGYHYNGLFRSVDNARSDGRGGKVKWCSNWIAFLECLLQFQIITKDTRCLMLPTGLRKLIIHPKKHQEAIDKIANDQMLEANRFLNITRCGGVEIRGLQTSIVKRRPFDVPVLETYQFVPNFSEQLFSKIDTARICVQLALENIPKNNVLIVEVEASDDKEPLIEFFVEALGDVPLVSGEFHHIGPKALELSEVIVQNCALSTFNNIYLTIY